MQTQLLSLVERTTRQLVPNDTTHPLVDLLSVLTEQFRAVVGAHRTVLTQLARASQSHHVRLSLYDLPDVWSRIQAVVNSFTITLSLDVMLKCYEGPGVKRDW